MRKRETPPDGSQGYSRRALTLIAKRTKQEEHRPKKRGANVKPEGVCPKEGCECECVYAAGTIAIAPSGRRGTHTLAKPANTMLRAYVNTAPTEKDRGRT